MPSAFFTGHDPAALPSSLKGGWVAIGNFDGVHRGHKAVLAAARAAGHPALALSFEPHPRTYFRPETPVALLTGVRERLHLLARAGLDGAVIMPFDAKMAARTAEDFVQEILVKGFDLKGVVVGHDFHFGKGRGGSPEFLREAGERHGFEVRVVEPVGDGAPVSSSAIRAHLQAGEVREANDLLGHRWLVSGIVEHGDKRGRDLGFPTANLHLAAPCPLAHGIYVVRIVTQVALHQGVASFGSRPMFDNGPPKLEVYLFDFSGDLYGEMLWVEFVDFLRPELRFDGVEALIAQMRADEEAARDVLAKGDGVESALKI